MPLLARKALAMSQLDASNLFLPIGSNWNEHSASFAVTTTGALAVAAARAGLAALDRVWKAGK